ncbi:Ferrienterobactin-binding periplasmic protein precursor [Raoultella ornithinolytica]|nr:Ferrienterobactin-binding periplasmic protein precursor [Raoultella ornithinolytica]
MNLSTLCRRTLLACGLVLLGITSALAADWPRQVTDSRGAHTLESQTTAHRLHQRHPHRILTGD